MKHLLTKYPICIFVLFLTTMELNAQTDSAAVKRDSIQPPLHRFSNTTLKYDILIERKRRKAGIEQTYNGGLKTVFIKDDQARVRLVTLMRVQSIFVQTPKSGKANVVVMKESGTKKYRYNLSPSDWKWYNRKYDSAQFILENDSLNILDFPCRKGTLRLQDGKEIALFYTDSVAGFHPLIEPAFAAVPGLVLQYEYRSNKGKVIFKAAGISFDEIDQPVFKIPAQGFRVKRYCPTCPVKNKVAPEEEEEETLEADAPKSEPIK